MVLVRVAGENQIRGQALRSVLNATDRVIGPGSRDRILVELRADVRDAFVYGAIVSAGWFPITWYCEMHRAIAVVGRDVADVHRKLGVVSTEHDVRGVYRFILGLTSPSIVIANLGRVLKTYIQQSTFEVRERGPEWSAIALSIPGASREVWADVAGSAEALLKLCGGANGTVELRLPTQSSPAVLTVRWGAK
jgi:hypothetical protein